MTNNSDKITCRCYNCRNRLGVCQNSCNHEIDHLTKLGEKHSISRCTKCGIVYFDGMYSPTIMEMWNQ